jgi:CMP-N,N'-diacetyllegionaminic acid synthase
MGLEILGIIPARAGSKGVPRKNIRPVGNKPLIAWTCEAALSAPSLTRSIISTDDQTVIDIARAMNMEVPFIRPSELASDTTLAIDVVIHALNWLSENEDYYPDFVLWLQPTSPLRTSEDIEAAISIQREKSAQSVISVCPVEHHPMWMKRIDANELLLPWDSSQEFPQRRQELPQAYRLNGAIYLTSSQVLHSERSFYPVATYAYQMPTDRSLDIDSPWDLYVADLILKDLRGSISQVATTQAV